MPNDQQPRRRIIEVAASVSAFIMIFAATWFVLDRTEHRPRWVVVEAPGTAVVGEAFEVRVTLDRSVEATMIVCTLHRANEERRGWGYLASSGPARPAAGGGTYAFDFVVPEKADTSFVFALVYSSPTGEWRDGTRAVATALIPVGPESRPFKKVSLHHYPTAARTAATRSAGEEPARAGRRPSAWTRSILAVLLVVAAYFALRAGRADPAGVLGAQGERPIWLIFAVILVVCAVVEVSGFAGDLASLGRRLAGQVRVYEYRKPFQKAVMAVMAAASWELFLLFIKATQRPGSHRRLWWAGMGLAEYLVVSSLGVLSFHAIDVLRGLAWHGISPFDALRGAGVAVTLLAAYYSVKRTEAGPLT